VETGRGLKKSPAKKRSINLKKGDGNRPATCAAQVTQKKQSSPQRDLLEKEGGRKRQVPRKMPGQHRAVIWGPNPIPVLGGRGNQRRNRHDLRWLMEEKKNIHGENGLNQTGFPGNRSFPSSVGFKKKEQTRGGDGNFFYPSGWGKKPCLAA